MANEILSYVDMCQREGTSLQRGMNFRIRPTHSVVLTSVRPGAPYTDRFEEGGTVLIYEGHDTPRVTGGPDPKTLDQPYSFPSGTPTQNGRFAEAARAYAVGERPPERVRVYEKLRAGVWSYNGLFHLVNAWQEESSGRLVFKFRLVAVEEADSEHPTADESMRRRLIPSRVKLAVWQRDKGECVLCGATDDLHFDHVIPFSKGGASDTPENVQILCARHNLAKSDRIE
jgi:hypothetical protein